MQFQSGPGHLILANAHTNTLEPLFGVFMSDWDMHCLCRMSRVVWKTRKPRQSNHSHELQRQLSKSKYKEDACNGACGSRGSLESF